MKKNLQISSTEALLEPSRMSIGKVIPTVRSIDAGTVLFKQSDQTFGMFFLLVGGIRLVRVTPGGAEVPMHTVRPNNFFAEASLFSENYHCDALALRDSKVLVYSKSALVNEFRQNVDELWAFSGKLAHRVQELRTRLQVRQIRSAPERILQALMLRCDARGFWQVEGTLKLFAEEIGLTHEALYRSLAELERNGDILRTEAGLTLVRLSAAPGQSK